MAKRWRHTTGVLVVLAVTLATLIVWRAWFPGRAFDRAAWQADAESGTGVRQAMADRLLARGTLLRLTRAEVVELLGDPPPTDYFRDWDLVYWLGPERGFIRIDSEWLVLQLGDDGRVAEARLVTD